MSTDIMPIPAQDLISAIAQAASDPQVDAAKMKALWDLKQSIDDRDARIAFNKAFVACRAELTPIVRDSWNDQTKSKYAKLETIDRAIKPALDRHGFAFFFTSPASDAKTVTVSGELLHTSGHAKAVQITGPIDDSGIKGTANKTPMHGLASSTTYLRRYLKLMAFDLTLTDEDNDGNGTAEVLTEEHLNKLRDVLIACDDIRAGVMEKFCRYMNVAKIEDIPERRFIDAMTAANNKYRELKGSAK